VAATTSTESSVTGDAGSDTPGDTASVHKSSRHKKKKSSTSTSAGTTNTAKTPASTTSATSTAAGKSSPATNPSATGTSSTTPAATGTSALAKTTKKKRHGKTGASTTTTAPAEETTAANVSGAPAKSSVSNKAPAAPAGQSSTAAVAPTPAHSATAAAAPPKTELTRSGHRKRHGKGTSTESATSTKPLAPGVAPAPRETIVVTPSTGPLTQQPVGVAPAIVSPATPSVGFGPTVQTGLPVARPGAGTTATLPTGIMPGLVQRPRPGSTSTYIQPALTKFPFTDYSLSAPKKSTHTYPWKSDIITTVFWIGEGGSTLSSTTNYQSAWNMDWIHDNGGSDDQDDMSGYASSLHASTLNPFYIALPFNDLVYPDKARRWIPSNWFKPSRNGKPVSACQDRWVEIKSMSGRTCFAQWEDVGPLRYDHAEYVFGNERPDTLTHAGLDVSPAVAKYLGINTHGAARTSWRFVDPPDVQPGMWLKYDEQAIIFKALEEQSHHGRGITAPIQDNEEPTPDDTSQDANQKKAGAARG
jgi:hypothetical protein